MDMEAVWKTKMFEKWKFVNIFKMKNGRKTLQKAFRS